MDHPGRPPSGAKPPRDPGPIKGAFRAVNAGGYGGERIPSARPRSSSRGRGGYPGESPRGQYHGESPRVEGQRVRSSSRDVPRASSRGPSGESPRVEGQRVRSSSRDVARASSRGPSPRDPSPRRDVDSDRPSSRPSSARPSSRGAERNFVEENRFPKPRSRPTSASSARSAGSNVDIAKDSNNVPKYLSKVKQAVAREKEYIAEISGLNKKDDGVPAGHRLLSEEERLEILEGLKNFSKDLEQQYQKLPLNIETDGQKRREAKLLKEMKDNEKAISLFSRPKVAVEL